ncbi:poly [ADP-ribose] polymerase tankyrase-2-like isoform X3 [Bolinopsis microptera]|uniref:poly [ADP-ribose] polymerase tankyrase-2-like isoform X3 n=1 Tax=Bolinopsis microptera TaxID=2820187 RepID=UPI00307AA47D
MTESAFLTAVDQGDTDAVKNLLSSDAGLKRLSGERNALHRAAGYGHLGIVCELTKAGFNPLTASHTGRIPLHEACQGGHTSVVEELLKYGGVEIADCRGQSPLHVAAYHGESQCVQLLCANSAQIAARDENHRTPVHLAAIMNQSETIHWLLEYGADVDLPDIHGRTCSHYASTVADNSSLKTLLERGVDLQVRCLQGRLPLHYSVTTDRLCNLNLLLAQHTKGSDRTNATSLKQAKLNLMLTNDNMGKCLGHIAAQNGSINCLHWMLEQGLDPNSTDSCQNTPLHAAASKSQILAFSCLLYHGASQEATNNKGETPMDVARKVGSPFAMGKAGQKKCPKCKQKGLDQEWETKNSPADIMVAIESSKDLLFHAPSEPKVQKFAKGGGGGGGSEHSLSSSTSSSTSLTFLPKRNMAAKFYGNFVN